MAELNTEAMAENLGAASPVQLNAVVTKLAATHGADKVGDVVTSLTDAARSIQQPSRKATNWIWLMVVASFCFVLVLSAGTLAVCLFVKLPDNTNAKVSPEVLLAMFTSVVGFLAGLFVPSPNATGSGVRS